MTLKLYRVLKVVEVHVRAKSHQASAAIRELSWSEIKKNSDENNTVGRYRRQ